MTTAPALGAPRKDVQAATSTQDEAKRLVQAGAPHGAVVVAAEQTAGRGRLGRPWTTLPDALAFSLILKPAMAPANAPRVTITTGVAVAAALSSLGVEAGIKWPNDVVVPATTPGPLGLWRKVAGVLVEVTFLGARLEAVVVGVGVNVRRPPAGIPDEIATLAGALSDTGYAGTKEAVLKAILVELAARLPALTDDFAYAGVLAEHRRRSATLGKSVTVQDGGEALTGRAIDVDGEGCLIVSDGGGHLRTIRAGDVWPAEVE